MLAAIEVTRYINIEKATNASPENPTIKLPNTLSQEKYLSIFHCDLLQLLLYRLYPG